MISPVAVSDQGQQNLSRMTPKAEISGSAHSPADFTMETGVFSTNSNWPNDPQTFFKSDDNAVLIVAQGLGQGTAAQTAAAITIDCLKTILASPRQHPLCQFRTKINEALAVANSELVQRSKQSGERLQSSTVVVVRQNTSIIAKAVGHCRAYLWRNQILQPLTSDHSLSHFLVSTASAAPLCTSAFRPRDILLNYLGRHDFQPNDELVTTELNDHDRLLLCSNGITSHLSCESLMSVLEQSPTAISAANSLGLTAMDRTARHDITCITLFVEASRQHNCLQ